MPVVAAITNAKMATFLPLVRRAMLREAAAATVAVATTEVAVVFTVEPRAFMVEARAVTVVKAATVAVVATAAVVVFTTRLALASGPAWVAWVKILSRARLVSIAMNRGCKELEHLPENALWTRSFIFCSTQRTAEVHETRNASRIDDESSQFRRPLQE